MVEVVLLMRVLIMVTDAAVVIIAVAALLVVAAALVALHVASDAEGLAAPRVRALERLLARVRVAVNAQRAGSGEGLVARLADVSVLGLRERSSGRRRDVVVVLPRPRPG